MQRSRNAPHILLINPWIDDFAAYDHWARPLGLLYIASALQENGFRVSYSDCLDRFHPRMPKSNPSARGGRGPYLKQTLKPPAGLAHIPRRYSRYGIRREWLKSDLQQMEKPDLILVTSMMTYWYPGVKATIRLLRNTFPDVPLWLGGIYATLCQDHANSLGADQVLAGVALEEVVEKVGQVTGWAVSNRIDSNDPEGWPHPALDLQQTIPFVPLLTAIGCPFRCRYCAAQQLNPIFRKRSTQSVLREIETWFRQFGVRDFTLYDDAFLIQSETHARPILEGIVRLNLPLRFHTPNALHVREIKAEIASLLFKAGFENIRLGLETTNFDERTALDEKVTQREFKSAVKNLRQAGFEANQVGAYLLTGLPGQSMQSALTAVKKVRQAGITPIPAYYTPIPHTALWADAVAASPYHLEADPIYTNNAIMPCWPEGFSWEWQAALKSAAHG